LGLFTLETGEERIQGGAIKRQPLPIFMGLRCNTLQIELHINRIIFNWNLPWRFFLEIKCQRNIILILLLLYYQLALNITCVTQFVTSI